MKKKKLIHFYNKKFIDLEKPLIQDYIPPRNYTIGTRVRESVIINYVYRNTEGHIQ